MKRRDFLKNLAVCSAGALLLPEMFLSQAAEASWQSELEDLNGVEVRPTYLRFGPLENRFRTNAVVLHHIGNTNADVPSTVVHRWHLNNGWSGIGYHFLIRKDGSIEQGRPMNMVGAHCYGENRHTVGINVVGDFTWAEPEPEQLDSAARLVAALCTYYGFGPSDRTVLGHCDLSNTACPGENLYSRIPEIIGVAADLYVPGQSRFQQDLPETGRGRQPEDRRNSRDRRHGARSNSTPRGGERNALPVVREGRGK